MGKFTSGEARSDAELRAAVADHGQGRRSGLTVVNQMHKRLGGERNPVCSVVGECSFGGCAGRKEMRWGEVDVCSDFKGVGAAVLCGGATVSTCVRAARAD
jgi:hypothetical protein